LTSYTGHFTVLVLCTACNVFLFAEPFHETSNLFTICITDLEFGEITSASGIIDLDNISDKEILLILGHYYGRLSCILLDCDKRTWYKLNLSIPNSSHDMVDMDGISVDNKKFQRLPAILNLQLIRYLDKMAQSYSNNNQKLYLILLLGNEVVKNYELTITKTLSCNLIEKVQFATIRKAMNMKVISMHIYNQYVKDNYEIPSYAVIIGGQNAIQLILLSNQIVNSQILCTLEDYNSSQLFTSVLAIYRIEQSCDMILFSGGKDGKLYRARITQQEVLGNESIKLANIKEIKGKRLRSFVMNCSYNEKDMKMVFFDHMNYYLSV
jgi:hypothetical protein